MISSLLSKLHYLAVLLMENFQRPKHCWSHSSSTFLQGSKLASMAISETNRSREKLCPGISYVPVDFRPKILGRQNQAGRVPQPDQQAQPVSAMKARFPPRLAPFCFVTGFLSGPDGDICSIRLMAAALWMLSLIARLPRLLSPSFI
jgi:hypothetical protein